MEKSKLIRKLIERKSKLTRDIYLLDTDTNQIIKRLEKEFDFIKKSNTKLFKKFLVKNQILKIDATNFEFSENYMRYLSLIKKILIKIKDNKAQFLISEIEDYQNVNTESLNVLTSI